MMRSAHRRMLIGLAVAALLLAAWAITYQDAWLPQARQWSSQAWRKATRPDASTLSQDRGTGASAAPRANAAASVPQPVHPRKCLSANGHVTYTDQACPSGNTEQPFGEHTGSERAGLEPASSR